MKYAWSAEVQRHTKAGLRQGSILATVLQPRTRHQIANVSVIRPPPLDQLGALRILLLFMYTQYAMPCQSVANLFLFPLPSR